MRGHEEFERLIHPLTTEDFFDNYWGKNFLYIERNDPHYFRNILHFGQIDEYLARNDLRYPSIRLVKEGRELPLDNYSHNRNFGENVFQGNLDTDALFREFADGATMCMQLQHLSIASISDYTRRIESYFGYRTQSTLFLTPPKSHGFTKHFDSHDFFAMGIAGEKTWRIYKTRADSPLPRTKVLDSDVDIPDTLEGEFTLKPGDTLYVPRGVYHDARSDAGTTLQISLGIFPYYWCDLLHTLIDRLADDHSELRQAVAPTRSIDQANLEARFRELIALIEEQADIPKLLETLQQRSASKGLKENANRLSDLEAVAAMSPETRFVAREIDVDVREVEGSLELRFYDKKMVLPTFTRQQLDVIVSGVPFSADTLPPSLDLEGRMFLLQKLVVEGLITFVRPSVSVGALSASE